MNIIKLYFLWGVGMIINLEDLRMHPHTSQEFSLHQDFSNEFLVSLNASFFEPVQVSIKLENNGRVLAGKGMVRTAINLACSRCLKEIVYQVNAPLNVIIESVMDKHVQEPEEHLLVIQDNGDVDLSSSVEEAILFNLPLIPLCGDDCRGLCSGCGVDLNTQKCCCEQQEIDPRWQKLKELK